MSHFKTTALISALLLMPAASAFAADAISKSPEIPVAPMQEVTQATSQGNWAGGYAGAYLGGAKNKFKSAGKKGAKRGYEPKFGAYAGVNFQNDAVVYGLEGDAGYNKARRNDSGLVSKGGFDGSIRGRVGYDMGAFMPYVTAGVAGTQTRYRNGAESRNNFRIGWTAGAGVEAKLTDNIVTRVEYRYSDFGKKDIAVSGVNMPGTKLKSQDIRVGIGYKF